MYVCVVMLVGVPIPACTALTLTRIRLSTHTHTHPIITRTHHSSHMHSLPLLPLSLSRHPQLLPLHSTLRLHPPPHTLPDHPRPDSTVLHDTLSLLCLVLAVGTGALFCYLLAHLRTTVKQGGDE